MKCPYCEHKLDKEKLKFLGKHLAKQNKKEYITWEAACNDCEGLFSIELKEHVTRTYLPIGVDKKLHLTLVN